MNATDTRPRRLVLSPTELELVRRRAGDVDLPPDFQASYDTAGNGKDPQEALAEAARALARRGVVQADPSADPDSWALHPSVAANIEILAHPELFLQTRIRVEATQVHAAHAIAGPLGAGLVRLQEDKVELSLFFAPDLGRELTRVVPEARTDVGIRRPPESVVPLEALEQMGPASSSGDDTAVEQVVGELGLGMEQARVVGVLDRQASGLLHTLVIRPAASPEEPARMGQVVWFATRAGWIGARREPGPQGERLVRLIPVERDDIGAWLAPVVAGVLE